VLDAAANLSAALGSNCQGFLGSCPRLEFPFIVGVLDMEPDVVGRGLEQIRHLPLGQPDRLVAGVEFISPSRGVNLAGVPRAAEIEREVRRLGLPIRPAPADVAQPG